MPGVRKFYHLILIGLLIIIGIILSVIFLRNSMPAHGIASTIGTTWMRIITRVLGVKVKIYGRPQTEKTLFVSNHISWLDIILAGSLVPINFLAKYEIKTIPVIGWLATRAGTLYIKRGNKISTRDAITKISNILRQKNNSLVFAEGTTSDGSINEFHSRILQSAIDAQAMVQPVAIFYPVVNPLTHKKTINPATLFVGNTRISETINSVFRESGIDAEVHFLAPVSSVGKTKEELAKYAFDKVVAAIMMIKENA